jgi:lipopolysaccharide transport system ATP-binding protein
MSDVIIQARNLGKSYRVALSGQREKYTALRDVLSRRARTVWRTLRRAQTDATHGQTEEFWALRDVSFAVRHGEAVAIIGRNGAGKSTLLKILSRITEPTAGRVSLRGRVASLLEVGTGFHPELTGRENIFLNGAILGMKRAEINRKFDEIVAFADVERFLDTPVKRYSSGMYVRLAFSVAAHLEPEVLVVDEVLAVGDAQFQQKCLGKMKQVSSEGRTVLFVSHNISAVKRLCTRAILLNAGMIATAGPVGEVVGRYLNEANEVVKSRKELDIRSRDVNCTLSEFFIRDQNDGLVVGLTLTGTHTLPMLGIGLTIRTDDGEIVQMLRPAKTGFGVRAADLPCQATFTLPHLRKILSGGRYWISIWVNDPGIETFGEVVDVLSFDIPETDIYGTGRFSKAQDDGIVSVACQFQISPSASSPAICVN